MWTVSHYVLDVSNTRSGVFCQQHAQKYYLLDRNIDDYKQEYSIIVCNVLALLTLFSTWESDSGFENA